VPYSQIFKDHFENPRNGGELKGADVVAEETNPVCGDRLRLALKINEGTIEAARFLAYGCPPVLVCGSALTELIQGKTTEEALLVTRKQLVAAVGGRGHGGERFVDPGLPRPQPYRVDMGVADHVDAHYRDLNP